LFTRAGFSKIVGVFVGGGRYFGKVSPIVLEAIESSMMVLPTTLRQVIASTRPFRLLLGVKMLAYK
jgi:hypothetical protein